MVNKVSLKELIGSLLSDQITCDWESDPGHAAMFSHIAVDGSADVNSVLGAQVTLSILGIRSPGIDDYRRAYDAGTQKQSLTIVGAREFTVQALIECTGEILATDVAERLISAFRRPSTLDALRSLDCALRTCSEVRGAQVPAWDQKTTTGAIVEIGLTWGRVEADPIGETGATVPNNWIETMTQPTMIEE